MKKDKMDKVGKKKRSLVWDISGALNLAETLGLLVVLVIGGMVAAKALKSSIADKANQTGSQIKAIAP